MIDYLEEEEIPPNMHPSIKIITWNCQGAGKPAFPVHCLGLKHSYHPHIMVIMETKISNRRAQRIIQSFGFQPLYRPFRRHGWRYLGPLGF